MEYKIKQELTEKDYMAYVTNQLMTYFLRPVNVLMYIVILAYMIFMLVTTQELVIFGFIGALALMNFMLVYFTRSRAKKFFNNNQDMIKMELVLKDDTLVYFNNDGNIEKHWYEFISAKESNGYIYIVVNKQSGLIVVKEQTNNETIEFLKKQLRTHLPKNKLKLK